MAELKRPTIIAGNWKMNKTCKEARELLEGVVAGLSGESSLPTIVVCPPFTALDSSARVIEGSPIKLGAQNVDYREAGAFTGEVSATMLIELGVKYVIIGHSERRQFFGETNQTTPLRVKAVLDMGMVPIICVGELLDERENNLTDPVVKRQVGAAVNGLGEEEIKRCVIAYEPVWAIGTGKVCEAKEAARVAKEIRNTLARFFAGKDDAQLVPVLYGGSMNAKNASEILNEDDLDGGLIGGASLKADEFLSIIDAAIKRPRALAGSV